MATAKQKAAQNRLARAAHACAGKKQKAFQSCVRSKTKK